METKPAYTFHRLIPDHELPECLKRPLVFGCDEQISALYDLEAVIEKREAELEGLKNGKLKTYEVTVEFTGEVVKQVYALSKSDAENKALEEVDMDECDFEVGAFAREAKGK